MITCRLFQKWVSWNADAGPGLPGWVRRHIKTCPACREFYDSMRVTVQALSAGAEGRGGEPSPFLRAKIMSAIRAQEEHAESQSTGTRFGWALAIGTACFLFTGVVWMHRHDAPVARALRPRPVPEELTLNLLNVAPVDALVNSLDKPLDNEMQFVRDDAQTAIKYLEKSFLPVEAEEPPIERDKPSHREL